MSGYNEITNNNITMNATYHCKVIANALSKMKGIGDSGYDDLETQRAIANQIKTSKRQNHLDDEKSNFQKPNGLVTLYTSEFLCLLSVEQAGKTEELLFSCIDEKQISSIKNLVNRYQLVNQPPKIKSP